MVLQHKSMQELCLSTTLVHLQKAAVLRLPQKLLESQAIVSAASSRKRDHNNKQHVCICMGKQQLYLWPKYCLRARQQYLQPPAEAKG